MTAHWPLWFQLAAKVLLFAGGPLLILYAVTVDRLARQRAIVERRKLWERIEAQGARRGGILTPRALRSSRVVSRAVVDPGRSGDRETGPKRGYDPALHRRECPSEWELVGGRAHGTAWKILHG